MSYQKIDSNLPASIKAKLLKLNEIPEGLIVAIPGDTLPSMEEVFAQVESQLDQVIADQEAEREAAKAAEAAAAAEAAGDEADEPRLCELRQIFDEFFSKLEALMEAPQSVKH